MRKDSMLKMWNWMRKHVLCPLKVTVITGGTVSIFNASGAENPFYALVPLGLILFLGYIASIQHVLETSKSGKPTNFPWA